MDANAIKALADFLPVVIVAPLAAEFIAAYMECRP